jgi:hypothetical protein
MTEKIIQLTQEEYNNLIDRKQKLEKRYYALRQRLGIKTKLTHGQKLPKEIWSSPYYKDLIKKKEELAEINKKLHNVSKYLPQNHASQSHLFMRAVEKIYPDIFKEVLDSLNIENELKK